MNNQKIHFTKKWMGVGFESSYNQLYHEMFKEGIMFDYEDKRAAIIAIIVSVLITLLTFVLCAQAIL